MNEDETESMQPQVREAERKLMLARKLVREIQAKWDDPTQTRASRNRTLLDARRHIIDMGYATRRLYWEAPETPPGVRDRIEGVLLALKDILVRVMANVDDPFSVHWADEQHKPEEV